MGMEPAAFRLLLSTLTNRATAHMPIGMVVMIVALVMLVKL
jgi:hypothetical protein